MHLKDFYTHAKNIPFANWADLHDYASNSEDENAAYLYNPQPKPKTLLVHLNILLRGKDTREQKPCKHCAVKAYSLIERSLTDTYGYSKEHALKVSVMAEIRAKEIEFWVTGNKFARTEAEIIKAQNAKLLNSKSVENVKYWKLLHDLEEITKVKIDPHKESLLNIFDRRNEIAQRAKKLETQNTTTPKRTYTAIR